MARGTIRELLNFDIDRYLNPYVPRNHINQLPKPVAHFLGWRETPSEEPPVVVQWISLFLATIAGLCVVSSAYIYAPGLNKYNPPVIIASLGATAVLDYNAIRSPLAQPRNAVLGQGVAALVGVGISKLFQLNPDFEHITWVSAAVACACASLAMSITNTVHPPGGATAILASTDASVVQLGWMFVPFALIGALLMLGVALLINNIFRQYPVWWWTSEDCGANLWRTNEHSCCDVEKRGDEAKSDADSDLTLHKSSSHAGSIDGPRGIHILAERVVIPEECALTQFELDILERIRSRLSS